MDRNEVVMDNAWIVYTVIKNMGLHGLNYHDREDILQVGFCALIEAVDRHDQTRGALSSIAYPYVRGRILQYLRKLKNAANVSRAVDEKMQRYFKKWNEENDSLDADKIADETGLPKDKVVAAINAKKPALPLLEELNGNDQENEIVERLSLRRALDKLDDKSRFCIEQYFFAERPQEDIGKMLGVSQPAAGRYVRNALEKLRKYMGDTWETQNTNTRTTQGNRRGGSYGQSTSTAQSSRTGSRKSGRRNRSASSQSRK